MTDNPFLTERPRSRQHSKLLDYARARDAAATKAERELRELRAFKTSVENEQKRDTVAAALRQLGSATPEAHADLAVRWAQKRNVEIDSKSLIAFVDHYQLPLGETVDGS